MEAASPVSANQSESTLRSLPQTSPASAVTQGPANFETRARRASSPHAPIRIHEDEDKALVAGGFYIVR